MEKLESTIALLKEINNTSDKILRTALPVMKSVITNKDTYIATLKKKYPDVDEKELTSQLKNASLGLAKDAQQIKKEMNTFVECKLLGDTSLENDIPYFTEIWQGDAYGTVGAQSLQDLLTDLKKQLSECTLENLLAKV